ncbi:MAG: riboflavin synthase [Synergistota bacterium]|nr:riboflavin synthase [Synergistota bacterium]
MFTGLVESIGRVRSKNRREDITMLEVADVPFAPEVGTGDSICVSGACLSAVSVGRDSLVLEMMPETVARTTLGNLQPGSPVNLERALRADGRLEGHIVTGHVDCRGRIAAVRESGRSRVLEIAAPAEFTRYMAAKGSVAIDGVSLTIMGNTGERFSVGLIPQTLSQTAIGGLVCGSQVNVECDIIAKYMEALLHRAGQTKAEDARSAGVTSDMLRNLGWA